MITWPTNEQAVRSVLDEYHVWLLAPDTFDAPGFFDHQHEMGVMRLFVGALIHGLAALLIWISTKLRAWRLVSFLSEMRLYFSAWGVCSDSCGRNTALVCLGTAKLRSGDIDGAIRSLDQAWRVNPCCHNTTFGLRMALCSELSQIPEAGLAVEKYREIARAFENKA